MELEQHNDIALNVQVVLQECDCHQQRGFIAKVEDETKALQEKEPHYQGATRERSPLETMAMKGC
jgi:hypothetical protein